MLPAAAFTRLKAMDVPAGKLRDKGTPIENLSKFDGAKDTIVYLTSAEDMKGRIFVFATKMAMVKQVPAEEFETNNRVVAATKLQEGDELAAVIPVEGETEVVIQTTGGVFLRFALEEISMLKKASRGVRGIRLTKNEELEKLYLIGENPIVDYKGKGSPFKPSETGQEGRERQQSAAVEKEVYAMSLSNTPTPHIGAEKGEIAGDNPASGRPLRAKYIAEHFWRT